MKSCTYVGLALLGLALSSCRVLSAPQQRSTKDAQALRESFVSNHFVLLEVPSKVRTAIYQRVFWEEFAVSLLKYENYESALKNKERHREDWKKVIIKWQEERSARPKLKLRYDPKSQGDVGVETIPEALANELLGVGADPSNPFHVLGREYFDWVDSIAKQLFPETTIAFRGHNLFLSSSNQTQLDIREDKAIHPRDPKVLSVYMNIPSSASETWFNRGGNGDSMVSENEKAPGELNSLWNSQTTGVVLRFFDDRGGTVQKVLLEHNDRISLAAGVLPRKFSPIFQNWASIPDGQALFAAGPLQWAHKPLSEGNMFTVTTMNEVTHPRCETTF